MRETKAKKLKKKSRRRVKSAYKRKRHSQSKKEVSENTEKTLEKKLNPRKRNSFFMSKKKKKLTHSYTTGFSNKSDTNKSPKLGTRLKEGEKSSIDTQFVDPLEKAQS